MIRTDASNALRDGQFMMIDVTFQLQISLIAGMVLKATVNHLVDT